MELTEDDIDRMIKQSKVNERSSDESYYDVSSQLEQLKQQILDDYEKARKWDYLMANPANTPKIRLEDYQNQKLRELIEKRIKFLKETYPNANRIPFEEEEQLQKLLKESKK